MPQHKVKALKIPRRFKMGGLTVTVRHDPELQERGKLGECWCGRHEIRISDESPMRQQEETFIHEVVEFANDQFDLQLAHQTISTLGVALHQALTTGEGELRKRARR